MFIQENAFENVVCEMASICLGLNVLIKSTAGLAQTGTRHTFTMYPNNHTFPLLYAKPGKETQWIP